MTTMMTRVIATAASSYCSKFRYMSLDVKHFGLTKEH